MEKKKKRRRRPIGDRPTPVLFLLNFLRHCFSLSYTRSLVLTPADLFLSPQSAAPTRRTEQGRLN